MCRQSGCVAMIRTVLIAEIHPLFAEALKGEVQRIDPSALVTIVDTMTAFEAALAGEWTALVFDPALTDGEGLASLARVRTAQPGLAVLVTSGNSSGEIAAEARALGARGFVSKREPAEKVRAALSVVLQGGEWFPARSTDGDAARLASLSPAQSRVMLELGKAQPNKLIAHHLNISEATVKSHLSAIYKALAVSSRSQAILALRQMQ
jgi:DNA-binding NarL/FixJ family response regulator